jgi:uncharacterized membrane protein
MSLTPDLPPAEPSARSFGARLRTWFFTGLVVFGPAAVTAYIAWWSVDTVDNWVRPWIPASYWPDSYLPFHVPGFGVIFALIGLTLLGFLTANIAGRTLLRIGERLLDRMPVVRSIYKSAKQIFETLFSQGGTQFRRVGLVEFPSKGSWSIVFISSEPARVVADALPATNHISVFLPCTPNPTTGFYFFVPSEEIVELPMTPDEAAKLIMSAGLIQPEGQATLAAMAKAAKAARESTRPALAGGGGA